MNAAFFKPSELRILARRAQPHNFTLQAARGAIDHAINETVRLNAVPEFDAFLAYSSIDWDVVYGLYLALKGKNISVYVDRIEDSHLDRTNVTPATAEALRMRMRQCRSLLFATTENLAASKWLPWEVGYFDGFRGKVAIVPVRESGEFTGQEYLGLYPVMEADTWLHAPTGAGTLIARFSNWLLQPR